MEGQKVTTNDILAMTAKYLRENTVSSTQKESQQQQQTNQNEYAPVDFSHQETQPKKVKQQETILLQPVQKVNIKASDKENSKKTFRQITTEILSQKLTQRNTSHKKINDPPTGSNFFYETHNAYNGCQSAAWQIEQSPNSLLKATVLAFAYHLPLRFKPDHILYAILAGFNIWVNEMGGHIKLAQKNLVNNSKKDIKIEISLDPNWDQVVDTLGERLEDAITNKNLVEVMKASFTTTTPTAMRVKNLTIASIMKKFVRIEFSTMCGIPYVTLEGTPQDWEKVKVVANALLALADGELNW